MTVLKYRLASVAPPPAPAHPKNGGKLMCLQKKERYPGHGKMQHEGYVPKIRGEKTSLEYFKILTRVNEIKEIKTLGTETFLRYVSSLQYNRRHM